jgi:hypothetical protein
MPLKIWVGRPLESSRRRYDHIRELASALLRNSISSLTFPCLSASEILLCCGLIQYRVEFRCGCREYCAFMVHLTLHISYLSRYFSLLTDQQHVAIDTFEANTKYRKYFPQVCTKAHRPCHLLNYLDASPDM